MSRKTWMWVGLGVLAYYLYQQSQANAGLSTGMFGPSDQQLPVGSMSPAGFPLNGLGARRRLRY